MRGIDVVVMIFLLVFAGMGIYIIWLNLPTGSIEYGSPDSDLIYNITSKTNLQFYNNLRYKDKEIEYKFDKLCDDKKQQDVLRAFSILSNRTDLIFKSFLNESELLIYCSEIAPEPDQEDHFIAGEGGPTEIINASRYYVIKSGKISLFRDDKCSKPNIALHEILHALGFDHLPNKESIMYPVTDCRQQIDNEIIREINRLYSEKSYPDIVVLEASANRTGRYLSFSLTVANYGLEDANDVNLSVYADDKLVKSFDLDEIPIGRKKIFTVNNLKVQKSLSSLEFGAYQDPFNDLNEKDNDINLIFPN